MHEIPNLPFPSLHTPKPEQPAHSAASKPADNSEHSPQSGKERDK